MVRLQILQNQAAKITLYRPILGSATNALCELRWKPLSHRRFYHRHLYVFKCVNNVLGDDIISYIIEMFIIITLESRTN